MSQEHFADPQGRARAVALESPHLPLPLNQQSKSRLSLHSTSLAHHNLSDSPSLKALKSDSLGTQESGNPYILTTLSISLFSSIDNLKDLYNNPPYLQFYLLWFQLPVI
jgi:hypothetical protein